MNHGLRLAGQMPAHESERSPRRMTIRMVRRGQILPSELIVRAATMSFRLVPGGRPWDDPSGPSGDLGLVRAHHPRAARRVRTGRRVLGGNLGRR
ncbi:hypothetical protein [Nocardia sp. NPDC003345]